MYASMHDLPLVNRRVSGCGAQIPYSSDIYGGHMTRWLETQGTTAKYHAELDRFTYTEPSDPYLGRGHQYPHSNDSHASQIYRNAHQRRTFVGGYTPLEKLRLKRYLRAWRSCITSSKARVLCLLDAGQSIPGKGPLARSLYSYSAHRVQGRRWLAD